MSWLSGWLVSPGHWNRIGLSRFIPKHCFGVCLYGGRSDRIVRRFVRIPLYRNLYMLLLCVFIMVAPFNFNFIDLHTVIQRLYQIRLCVRLIYIICLHHLEAMYLSALNPCFIIHLVFVGIPVITWTFAARIYLSVPVPCR